MRLAITDAAEARRQVKKVENSVKKPFVDQVNLSYRIFCTRLGRIAKGINVDLDRVENEACVKVIRMFPSHQSEGAFHPRAPYKPGTLSYSANQTKWQCGSKNGGCG